MVIKDQAQRRKRSPEEDKAELNTEPVSVVKAIILWVGLRWLLVIFFIGEH